MSFTDFDKMRFLKICLHRVSWHIVLLFIKTKLSIHVCWFVTAPLSRRRCKRSYGYQDRFQGCHQQCHEHKALAEIARDSCLENRDGDSNDKQLQH